MEAQWDRFGAIVCIHYAPYRDRKARMDAELERVGILPSCAAFRYHWTARGEIDERMHRALHASCREVPRTVPVMNLALAHQVAIRACLEDGCENALILEDDVRFLNCVDGVHNAMAAWLDGDVSDICLFDKFLWSGNRNRRGATFTPFDAGVRGASCYALNRVGMGALCDAADNLMRNRGELHVSDALFDFATCRKVFANLNVCIQADTAEANNVAIYRAANSANYAKDGVDLTLYNV